MNDITTQDDRQGVIVAHLGVAVEVRFDAGGKNEIIRVKRNSGHVVGDKVTVKGEILTRLERKSVLNRMDARGVKHTVGANLDTLCIVVACEPMPPPGFIDRAIVAARTARLRPTGGVDLHGGELEGLPPSGDRQHRDPFSRGAGDGQRGCGG